MSIEQTFRALRANVDGVAAIRAELDAVLQQFVASPEGRSIEFSSGMINELPGGVHVELGTRYNEEMSGKAHNISLIVSAQGRVEIARDIWEERADGGRDWWQDKTELDIDVHGKPADEAARIIGAMISSEGDVVAAPLNRYVVRMMGLSPGQQPQQGPEI